MFNLTGPWEWSLNWSDKKKQANNFEFYYLIS